MTGLGLEVRGQDLRSSPLATLSRLPKEPRRHTVDGTTSTRLRTHASGEAPSECVATVSVSGRRFCNGPRRSTWAGVCRSIRASGWPVPVAVGRVESDDPLAVILEG